MVQGKLQKHVGNQIIQVLTDHGEGFRFYSKNNGKSLEGFTGRGYDWRLFEETLGMARVGAISPTR